MTTKIYLAKYVSDPARWEPRNVGVVIDDGTTRRARFLAEDDRGKIEGYRVRYAVGAPTEVYREWVSYWRRVLLADGADPLGFTDTAGGFFIQEAGEVFAEEEARPIDAVTAEYFARLVSRDDETELALRDAVEQLVDVASLAAAPGFSRDVEVKARQAKAGETPEVLRFEYGRQNGSLIVGHRVPLQIEAFVHDALYRYARLPESVRPVTFVQGFADESAKPAVRNLEVWSTVVDVADPDASSDLARAFDLH